MKHVGTTGNAKDIATQDQLGGGGGSASITSVTVDFGTNNMQQMIFDIALPGATVGQQVIATPSLDMPAGIAEDELEMDMLTCAAKVLSANNIRLIVASLGGAITGQRNINIVLG